MSVQKAIYWPNKMQRVLLPVILAANSVPGLIDSFVARLFRPTEEQSKQKGRQRDSETKNKR